MFNFSKIINRIIGVFFFSAIVIGLKAQHNPRITFQASPLLSYLNVKNEESPHRLEGIETPRLGYSLGLRAEFDIDKYLGINVGFSYERRNNEYTVDYQDIEENIMYLPDKSKTKYTYEFYGLPVSFKIKYFNRSKISIYQNIGLQVSWIQSITYESTAYYEDNITSLSGNYNEYKDGNIVSLFSSIGISKMLNEKWTVLIEPGFIYALNNFAEWTTSVNNEEQHFFDIKVDVGLSYYF